MPRLSTLTDSKYTTFGLDRADGRYAGIRSNFFGNHKKNLLNSVRPSPSSGSSCMAAGSATHCISSTTRTVLN